MAVRDQVTTAYDVATATIVIGQSLSSAVTLGGLRLFGIIMPAAFTGTTLTFQMSHDGGTTWSNVYDNTGSEYALTVGTSRYVAVDLALFSPLSWIKMRSGKAGSPTSEGADRTLQLLLRGV